MKYVLFLICVLLTTKQAAAQQEAKPIHVPSEVKQSLDKKFPDATGIEWTQKKEGYKAEFKVVKTKHEVWLDKTGTISKHQYEIKKTDLPKAVTDAIAKEFSTYTTHDCERTDSGEIATYKVELRNSAGKKKVNFRADGKVIPKNDD